MQTVKPRSLYFVGKLRDRLHALLVDSVVIAALQTLVFSAVMLAPLGFMGRIPEAWRIPSVIIGVIPLAVLALRTGFWSANRLHESRTKLIGRINATQAPMHTWPWLMTQEMCEEIKEQLRSSHWPDAIVIPEESRVEVRLESGAISFWLGSRWLSYAQLQGKKAPTLTYALKGSELGFRKLRIKPFQRSTRFNRRASNLFEEFTLLRSDLEIMFPEIIEKQSGTTVDAYLKQAETRWLRLFEQRKADRVGPCMF